MNGGFAFARLLIGTLALDDNERDAVDEEDIANLIDVLKSLDSGLRMGLDVSIVLNSR